MRTGRGNNNSCPHCRSVIYQKPTPTSAFDVPSIWAALCGQPPELLHPFMAQIWSGLQSLWKRKNSGTFTVTDLLSTTLLPALISTADPQQLRGHDPFLDAHNIIAASWNSLGRPNRATGLAIPLVRLARLMSGASATVPKWLTTVGRANKLFWTANACLDITQPDISWENIMSASRNPSTSPYFPLLHLYTMLVSQSIAHDVQLRDMPTKRHEVMNLVMERCCRKIGSEWSGRPSNEFKDVLVEVYEELRRWYVVKKRASLRGHEGEEELVKGFWAMARWSGK